MNDNSSTAAQAAETETKVETTSRSEPENTNVPTPHARTQIQTVRLDSRDFRPSWPTTIAALEQLSGWAVLALRLGTLALIQQCVRELAEENARADALVRLRILTDALAHIPLET